MSKNLEFNDFTHMYGCTCIYLWHQKGKLEMAFKETDSSEYTALMMQDVKRFMELYELTLKNSNSKDHFEKEFHDFFVRHLFPLVKICSENEPFRKEQRDVIKHKFEKLALFHYTDFEALKLIIEGKSWKLNHISKMNDREEGETLIRILTDENRNWFMFMENFEELRSRTYSLSLTTCKDDASLWVAYGTPKKLDANAPSSNCGVCIQISMPKLLEFLKKIREDFKYAELTPILYYSGDDDNHVSYIKSQILNKGRSMGDKDEFLES